MPIYAYASSYLYTCMTIFATDENMLHEYFDYRGPLGIFAIKSMFFVDFFNFLIYSSLFSLTRKLLSFLSNMRFIKGMPHGTYLPTIIFPLFKFTF